jgi:hypothetical protein
MNSNSAWTKEIGMNSAEMRGSGMPEWWAVAPAGERRFLGGLARMMRSAKGSKSPDVAQAASKWERALGCFIKVRLMGERRRAARRRWQMADGKRRGGRPPQG